MPHARRDARGSALRREFCACHPRRGGSRENGLARLCRRAGEAGCRVTRVSGVESESEFAFAGLLQLLAGPLLDQLEQLGSPQRDALKRAFGLIDGPSPKPFLVSLAGLNLLSKVAAEQPLVCLVDDVQWLDRASVSALSFITRRLAAEPIAMLFGLREPSTEQELNGVPELVLEELSDADAQLLLDSAIPGGLDDLVRDRIVRPRPGATRSRCWNCLGEHPPLSSRADSGCLIRESFPAASSTTSPGRCRRSRPRHSVFSSSLRPRPSGTRT